MYLAPNPRFSSCVQPMKSPDLYTPMSRNLAIERLSAPSLLQEAQLQLVRSTFPFLKRTVHNLPLAYLDNAATTQVPDAVIDAMRRYYQQGRANTHRSSHYLAYRSEELIEGVRSALKVFLHAEDVTEIVFSRGTTDALHQIAEGYGATHLTAGDEVILTALAHHSEWMPWERVTKRKGAHLKVLPLSPSGSISLRAFKALLSPRTQVVSLPHVSHVTGKELPIAQIAEAAHEVGAIVVVDGAQSVAHQKIDVQVLGADFFVFSGHKLYGPTGIGVLYGRRFLLDKMVPWEVGGGVISGGVPSKWTYAPLPHRLEAGTLPMGAIVGLGSALSFLDNLGAAGRASGHTTALAALLAEKLSPLSHVSIIGQGERKGIVSFAVEDAHPLDLSVMLDLQGIAVRAGSQCALPLMQALGLQGVIRASFGLYNTPAEVERLVDMIAGLPHNR